MVSPDDIIIEESDRFMAYFDVDKIVGSHNPYQEFLRQFVRVFSTPQGINLWGNIKDKNRVFQELFADEIIQKNLPETISTRLPPNEIKIFLDKRDKRIKKVQERRREKVRIEPTKKRLKYLFRMERFILSRKNMRLSELTYEFNVAFKINKTTIALRDKRLRLLGRKK